MTNNVRDRDACPKQTTAGVRSPVKDVQDREVCPTAMNDVRDRNVRLERTTVGVSSPVAHRAINDISSADGVGKTVHSTDNHQSIVNGVGNTVCINGAHQSIAVSSIAIHEKFTSGDSIVESSMSGDRFSSHDGASLKNPDHSHSTINYLMVACNKSSVSHPLNNFCHTFPSKSGVSSMRSRAAASAWYHKSSSQVFSRSAVKHHLKRKKKKMAKQSNLLAIIGPTDERVKFGMKYSTQF